MLYDLLIKGGHVLDPGQGIDAMLDIGVSGTTIARIAPDIPTAEAARTIEIRGAERYVVPGLIDIHTHIAYGAITRGVGMEGCDPDVIGVGSGVTTLLDCGSVGVANIGVFPAYIIPRAKTRIVCYLNIGSFAHTTPGIADMRTLDELDADAIGACIDAYPGLIKGLKLRLVGDVATRDGEELIRRSKAISSDHHIPLMTHIGNLANADVMLTTNGWRDSRGCCSGRSSRGTSSPTSAPRSPAVSSTPGSERCRCCQKHGRTASCSTPRSAAATSASRLHVSSAASRCTRTRSAAT